MQHPVAFFIFNRPETTRRVFEEIRRARPSKLMVVADGPRLDRPSDADACTRARAVVETVDWPCDVEVDFAEFNLGCGRRLATGLDWVFGRNETAVVLEDDCLPHPTFFRFCDELLDRYASDERIMHVGGSNLWTGPWRTRWSYGFSRNIHVWGWASWRRAWRQYDVEIRLWDELRAGAWLEDLWGDRLLALDWRRILDRVARGEVDTWDYQWAFACQVQNGFGVVPAVNLVQNIGFDSMATHVSWRTPWTELPIAPMEFPLRHPPYVIADRRADRAAHWSKLAPSTLVARLLARLPQRRPRT